MARTRALLKDVPALFPMCISVTFLPDCFFHTGTGEYREALVLGLLELTLLVVGRAGDGGATKREPLSGSFALSTMIERVETDEGEGYNGRGVEELVNKLSETLILPPTGERKEGSGSIS